MLLVPMVHERTSTSPGESRRHLLRKSPTLSSSIFEHVGIHTSPRHPPGKAPPLRPQSRAWLPRVPRPAAWPAGFAHVSPSCTPSSASRSCIADSTSLKKSWSKPGRAIGRPMKHADCLSSFREVVRGRLKRFENRGGGERGKACLDV